MKIIKETHTKETFFQKYLNKGFIKNIIEIEIIFNNGNSLVSKSKVFFVKASQYGDRIYINENCLCVEDIDYFAIKKEVLTLKEIKPGVLCYCEAWSTYFLKLGNFNNQTTLITVWDFKDKTFRFFNTTETNNLEVIPYDELFENFLNEIESKLK